MARHTILATQWTAGCLGDWGASTMVLERMSLEVGKFKIEEWRGKKRTWLAKLRWKKNEKD